MRISHTTTITVYVTQCVHLAEAVAPVMGMGLATVVYVIAMTIGSTTPAKSV
jgi:hypothetical protein